MIVKVDPSRVLEFSNLVMNMVNKNPEFDNMVYKV